MSAPSITGKEFEEKVRTFVIEDVEIVYAVNADEEQELMVRYGVRAIPTLIVFKDGQVYKQNTGFIPKDQVLDLLK